MRIVLMSLLTLFLASCSGISKIGDIAGHEFYSVNANNVWAKSHSMVVIHDTHSGKVSPASTGVGSGLIADLLGAGATVGAAYWWGSSLEPDTFEDNSSTAVEGGNSSQVQGQGQLQGQNQSSYNKNHNHNSNKNKNSNSNKNSLKNSNKNFNWNKNSNKNTGGGNVRQNGGGRGGNHNN